MNAIHDLTTYEKSILSILRTLPLERAAQLVDFARYLQGLAADIDLIDETEESIEADEAIWDTQFAASEKLFSKMADKVRGDIAAGRTSTMKLTRDGKVTSG